MQFKVLGKESYAAYDEFVKNCSHSMLYHTRAYLQFAAQLLNCEIELHSLEVDNRIVASCAWLVKEDKLGKVFNSLAYFGANGGVFCADEEMVKLFLIEMTSYLKTNSTSYTYITNPFQEWTLDKADFTQNRMAQVTPMGSDSSEDKIMESFHYKTRNMVRKGLKENLTFLRADDLTFLSHTHKQNMEAVGVAPKSNAFFDEIGMHFKRGVEYEVFENSIEGEKAAALLVFYHKQTVEYYMPAINVAFRNKQPMSALILHVMQDSIDKGYRLWNWGGTPISNENLYRFKSRFGAIDKPYTIQGVVNDFNLLSHSIQEVTAAYPGMFVVPFDMLTSE